MRIRPFPASAISASLRLHSISAAVDREFRERRMLGHDLQRREELRIAGALQEEPDMAGGHRIPRQPDDAGEQRHHHLGILAGVGDAEVVNRRHHDEARAQDRIRKLAHHQAADLAGRVNPLTVRKAITGWGCRLPWSGASISGEASGRKRRKVLADAFGVLLPLALDRPPGPVRLFHRQKAHD